MVTAFYENLEREREENTINRDEEVEKKPNLSNQIDKQQKNNGFLAKLGKWVGSNIGIILAVIAVLLAATGFTFASKKKQKSISKYMNKIDDTYTEYKMKAKRCEAELYRLKDIVDDELKSGKIDDSAYQLLMNRIENYMVDIQKQIVNEKFGGLPSSLKDEMFKMMEDGEVTSIKPLLEDDVPNGAIKSGTPFCAVCGGITELSGANCYKCKNCGNSPSCG